MVRKNRLVRSGHLPHYVPYQQGLKFLAGGIVRNSRISRSMASPTPSPAFMSLPATRVLHLLKKIFFKSGLFLAGKNRIRREGTHSEIKTTIALATASRWVRLINARLAPLLLSKLSPFSEKGKVDSPASPLEISESNNGIQDLTRYP